MRPNLPVLISMTVALAASTGCLASVGDESEDTSEVEVDFLAAGAITGAMEFDVAVDADTYCGDCSRGPYVVGSAGGGPDNMYGDAFFRKTGDYFSVMDYKPDSRSVGVNWQDVSADRQGICVSNLGSGSEAACNKNLPEGDYIRYRVGRCDASFFDCKKWENYTDVTAWGYTKNDN